MSSTSNLDRNHGIARSLALLSNIDRRRVVFVALLQTLLGFLDLIAIAIFGMLGALTVSGLEAENPGNRVSKLISVVNLDEFNLQAQVTILGLTAIVILISKTVLSVLVTKRTLRFLARRSADLARFLVSRVLSQPLTSIQKKPTQELIYDITVGVSTLTVGVLGALILLVSDLSLLMLLLIALIVVDPVLAGMTFILFGSLTGIIYVILGKQAKYLGARNQELLMKCSDKLIEVLNTYREASVRSRKLHYVNFVSENRRLSASSEADMTFMPYVGKYVMESSVLLGACLISAIQFYRHDAYHAATTLVIFVSAGMRIAPAMLRIQQGAVQIKLDTATTKSTYELIQKMQMVSPVASIENKLPIQTEDFGAVVDVSEVTYSYPDSGQPAIKNLNLRINSGETLAIVGPSGAGKSTLADLLLGVLQPDFGSISISGFAPKSAILEWPGLIGYVPQDVYIVAGSILQNVALGFDESEIQESTVWEALKLANLDEFVSSLPRSIHTVVGERGSGLSGGQRQRLGIARAMFTRPKLLVLDEATSALDGQTEVALSGSIQRLRGEVTVVLIAHRLSTVRDADNVLYLSNGETIAMGDFDYVRQQVPDFDIQAKLLGL